jgi:hypothetical protein
MATGPYLGDQTDTKAWAVPGCCVFVPRAIRPSASLPKKVYNTPTYAMSFLFVGICFLSIAFLVEIAFDRQGNSSEVVLILGTAKYLTAKSETQRTRNKVRPPVNNSSPYYELYNWSVTASTSFWQCQADANYWQTPFHRACDFTIPPFARCFVGGKANLSFNAVDRHLETRGETPTNRNGRSHG